MCSYLSRGAVEKALIPTPLPLQGRGAFIRAQSEATRGVRSWLVVGGRLGDQVVESVGR
jgi:hypothetical protein